MTEDKINQSINSTNTSSSDQNTSRKAIENGRNDAEKSGKSMTQKSLSIAQGLRCTERNNQFLADVEGGLRFIHQMEVQGRIEQTQLAIESSALADLLIAKGIISAREFDERKQQAAVEQTKRDEGKAYPVLGDVADKYQIETPPIPCAQLVHICRAACCNLSFSLTLQDLEEGVVRWNYNMPYVIRNDKRTGKCIHFDNGEGCSVYPNRPAVCRAYDCREDKRIWKDFEMRVPAPDLKNLAPVATVPLSMNEIEQQEKVNSQQDDYFPANC